MKRFLIIVAALVLIQQWSNIHDLLTPARDYSYLKGSHVTLYSTAWCQYCAETRHFLQRNKIAYNDYDIEKSQWARKQFDALGGGGVPLVVVNKQLIRGYNPSLILKYLDEIPAPAKAKDMS